jgi:hypothetical protein
MEPLESHLDRIWVGRMEYEIDLPTKDLASQPIEWIPLVDWFAGMTGACVIAALLWVAIAIA